MLDFYSFYKNEISGSHLFEWLIILLCFISLVTLEFTLKKFNNNLTKYFERYQLKYPFIDINYRIVSLILSIIVLSVGAWISYYFSGSYHNLSQLIKVVVILFAYNLCNKYLKTNIQLRIISLLIVVPMILDTLGLLDLIILDLDLIGFEVGKTNLTLLLLVKTIYIGAILFWIGKYISKIGESWIKQQTTWNINTKIILLKFFNIFLYIILIIIGLNILGFDFTTLALFSGAFVFALTLSMQKIASNFLSGMILLFEKAIKVNDVIEVQNGVKGKVKYLGARTTVIDAQDGSEVTVPNEDIINSKIISWSGSGRKKQIVKTEIIIELSIENDPKEVCKIFLGNIKQNSECAETPEAECVIANIVKNNVEYHITFWTSKEYRAIVRTEVLFNIWQLIKENNLKLAVYY